MKLKEYSFCAKIAVNHRQVPSNLEGMHIPDLKWIKSYYTQQKLRLTNSLCRVIPIVLETYKDDGKNSEQLYSSIGNNHG